MTRLRVFSLAWLACGPLVAVFATPWCGLGSREILGSVVVSLVVLGVVVRGARSSRSGAHRIDAATGPRLMAGVAGVAVAFCALVWVTVLVFRDSALEGHRLGLIVLDVWFAGTVVWAILARLVRRTSISTTKQRDHVGSPFGA